MTLEPLLHYGMECFAKFCFFHNSKQSEYFFPAPILSGTETRLNQAAWRGAWVSPVMYVPPRRGLGREPRALFLRAGAGGAAFVLSK